MATTPATKKRNPQDATLRNVRALKARVSALEKWAAAAGKELSKVYLVSRFVRAKVEK